MAAAREHGELVDRLMARIGELEAKLYDKELADAHFTIPAIHGAPPSPRTAATTAASALESSVNRQLLDSLGDPDKLQPGQQPQARDWRAAASSWLAASPLARSALSSLTAASTSNTATAAADPSAEAAATSTSAAHHAADQQAYAAKLAAAAAGPSSSSFSTDSDSSSPSCSNSPPAAAAATAAASYAAAAARSPRVSSSAVPAAPSSSGSSFTFHPKVQESLHATFPPPSTAAAPALPAAGTGQDSTSPNHRHSKSNGDGAGNGQRGGWGGLRSYYRYIMSPTQEDEELAGLSDADIQRVQEAAGAALAEANERLLEAELRVQAAQAAQRQLQQQIDAAEQLQADMEALKTENLEAWRQKYDLEGQLAAARANMDSMRGQAESMQQELDGLRQQAQIWCDSRQGEDDKLKAEVELLSGQLLQRSNDLSSLREQLTEARSERDMALQERQQALEERERLQQQLQQVSSLQQQLAAATAAAAESAASAAEYQEKFIRERAVRRRLHEQLQVLRGNIRVMCRVRPAGKGPKSPTAPTNTAGSASCISVPLDGLVCVNDASTARQWEFEFDAAFGPESSQEQVFEQVSPLVRSCADGYNVCIFAYGQTGSGKTYTMEGPADNPGINSRALQELFKIAGEEGEAPSPWSFSVSMMEIYNEAVRDLLATTAAGGSSSSSNLPVGVHAVLDVSGLPAGELPPHIDRVPGLVWRSVACPEDVAAVLWEGWRARATAATALNAASSRSHAVLCVKVRGVREGRPFTSLLYLVDLAGSERVDKSEVTGQQMKEAQAINKSLSSLGDVISALQRRSPHIPFRNSKLTQVLQDSLCGSSKVLLVCNLSPEAASCNETLSSLNFASRAAQVELGQARRVPAAPPAAAAVGSASASEADNGQGQPTLSSEPSTGSLRSQQGAAAGASLRPKSPVFSSTAGAGRTAGAAGGTAAWGGTAAGGSTGSPVAVRPSSRLGDRVAGSVGGLAGSGGSLTSPRVSMAKPARH